MSYQERMEAQDVRRRQVRAQIARQAARLEREGEAARWQLEAAAAKLALGEGDDEAVIEAEARIDILARDLRRARAALAGLN